MAAGMTLQRFSASKFPSRMRRELVESVYGQHVRGSIDFPQDQPIAVDMRLRPVGDLHLAMVEASPFTIFTPPDDSGVLYLGIALAGGGVIDAEHESRPVKAGDINVMRREHHCLTIADRPTSILSIAIPYHRILHRLVDSARLTQTLSAEMPAARLLRSYASTLLDEESTFSAEEQSTFAGHIADLAALLLGPSRDAGELAQRGGVRAARGQAVRADVRANLGNPALSLDWLSRRHALSCSYIRALFYDDGTSFTEFVNAVRLDHIAALLRDPRLSGHTIAALALTAGFGDISWFNQVFRRRFGMTPSELRAGGERPDRSGRQSQNPDPFP
jgi:AraC-like DNA-binding protein